MPQLSTEIPDGRAELKAAWFYPIVPVAGYCLFAYGYFWSAVSGLALLSLACYKQWQANIAARDEELLWYANRTLPIFICSEYPGEDIHPTACYCQQMLEEVGNKNKYAKVHEFHFQSRPGAARETWSEYEIAANEFMKELEREAQMYYFDENPTAYPAFFYSTDKTNIYENSNPNTNVASRPKSV